MTTLCLACSSSLLTKASDSVFITACCGQPICTTCIQSNPRLARYNPCLACLGGVAAVGAAASSKIDKKDHRNVDGAVRDEDTFAIGDDDDPESDSELPPYTSLPEALATSAAGPVQTADPSLKSSPGTYYIKPGDTLPGIALRFRVDGRTLCRLNKLPPSTLSTTPHLLHTRTSLQLPPSAYSQLGSTDATPSPIDVHAREVSRAGKRLQMLTKETDWRIARAYVALADDPEVSASFALKRKELGNTPTAVSAGSSLDAVATDRYLDDLEWEAEQLKAGRPIRINPFPMNPIPTQNSSSKIKARSWW
ncbi:LysM domain-containing protein [Favolaschia claudopus]|uniref:LysM domain-containing protein n=1 Tax=Favolaschia claudopus TaxID=2862362 RepID=A0AAW0C1D0_9AGAR